MRSDQIVLLCILTKLRIQNVTEAVLLLLFFFSRIEGFGEC